MKGTRIYPSGAMISQTSGHGDFLPFNAVPRDEAAGLDFSERFNFGILADGADQVLKRTREQLRLGATRIKLAAGGGVSSNYDPLDVSEFTEAEMKAAVDGAENWGTYVTVYLLAKKYNIKTAFGTDCLFQPNHSAARAGDLTKLLRWYTPFEILKMATSTNAQLLVMSGPRNPYPDKLGVIEEGAYAELLLVEGNPLINLDILENYDKNILLIMKDGVIYKNMVNN